MEKSSEKESSRRSWPWKRKSNDKISAAPELGPSPVASKSYDNHQIWEYRQPDVASHQQRQQSPLKASAGMQQQQPDRSRMQAVDEARGQWLQSEERAKILAEKLSTALADITSKDNLVKQHVKVAEEAVSGWEKAEAEAVSLKAQLDAALQQKLATEDRVAHLDGALKECMKQLRHLREENEQRIHDTLLKKSREYDTLRLEMETKLAESSHFLSQTRAELLESRAEVTAVNHALQERLRTIAEISDAKARAETDIKVLQVRLETMEKDNSQLKYEVHVLNKELDIRSQEREYERKAVDLASKQHLETVKKIAKLEEECNRLRLLVRKKLPGPAAIQRMRMEVEGTVPKDPAERRRRAVSRSGSNLDLAAANVDAMQESGQTHEAQMLAERVVAMDEEMKMLKEALSQRNGEIQASRLLCSKTSAQLSAVEDELKKAKHLNEALKVASNSRPPSGLQSQDLSSRKSGSLCDNASAAENRSRESQVNFELMDDFAEMERLAMSATTLTEPAGILATSAVTSSSKQQLQIQVVALEEALAAKTRDLETKAQDLRGAEQMCQELRAKLKEAEKQLQGLQSQNASNEACIVKLQEELDVLSERERGRRSGSQQGQGAVAPGSKRLSGYTLKDILGRAKSTDAATPPEAASSSEGAMPDEQASVSDAESKASTGHLELAIALRKIVLVVEMLAQTSGFEYTPSLSFSCATNATNSEIISLQLDWQNHDLKAVMRNLAHVSNKFLEGKRDLVDFTIELGTVLDYILAHKPQDRSSSSRENNADILRGGSPAIPVDLKLLREQCAFFDAELDRLRSEKADISVSQLKVVEQAESLRPLQPQDQFKLLRTHGALQHHQHGGDSPIASNDNNNNNRKEEDLIEEELMVLSSPNPALRAASGELTRLRDRVAGLERELQGERQRNQGIAAKLVDQQQQHHVQREGNAVSSEMSGGSHRDLSSHSTSEEDEDSKPEKLVMSHSKKLHERQERDVQAAALAECQRTILALGKQLKGLGSGNQLSQMGGQLQDERDTSPKSTHSSRSIEKMTENMELLRWQTEAAAAAAATEDDGETAGLGAAASANGSTYSLTTGALREHGNQWASPSPRRAHHSPSPAGGPRRAGHGGLYPPSPGFQYMSTSGQLAVAIEAATGSDHNTPPLNAAAAAAGQLTPKAPSPSRSDLYGQQGSGSVPGSPSRSSATTPWALRSRTKAVEDPQTDSEASSVEKSTRSSSSFSRFYSRTRSGSIVGGSFG